MVSFMLGWFIVAVPFALFVGRCISLMNPTVGVR